MYKPYKYALIYVYYIDEANVAQYAQCTPLCLKQIDIIQRVKTDQEKSIYLEFYPQRFNICFWLL